MDVDQYFLHSLLIFSKNHSSSIYRSFFGLVRLDLEHRLEQFTYRMKVGKWGMTYLYKDNAFLIFLEDQEILIPYYYDYDII